jgi:2-succinyl-5-enolpyruvyl-6-hydroxy-3-cyclohexene-1-carboxylate synthase
MNPSTALAVTLADELIRCGLTEVVLAPGSRSAPLAMEFHRRAGRSDLRLHVRIDERSAAYLALGLAKAGGRPAAVLCTSGTAAASFHPAVIEASESGVPLLVLTADRPPELRGTGANQAIDQIKLYGDAVRWFSEVGVPEDRPGPAAEAAQTGYWRSLTGRAWGSASGAAGGLAGPVHLNLAFRDPLVPDRAPAPAPAHEALDGRAGGAPWVRFAATPSGPGAALDLPWTERGLIVCGDGLSDETAGQLLALAAEAGWPVLAEPSSGARRGPDALSAYQYLLAAPGFLAAHRPDVIVTAGRPGLSRGQTALLRGVAGSARHVVIAAQPGRWDDPARTATDVAPAVRLALGAPAALDAPAAPDTAWRREWRRADAAARKAVDALLDAEPGLSEPRLARDLAAALPDGALLWAASSMPIRDLDQQLAPRTGLRVLASRGASGIDGTTSAAIGAALAHQAAGGGPAVALIGDLALLHDSAGLFIGPDEPRPDLCLVVVNNDGGGIFSTLEQASFPGSFERVFGTPHGADVGRLAAAAGLPYQRITQFNQLVSQLAPQPAGELASELAGALAGSGLRVVELRTSRPEAAELRNRLQQAATAAVVVSPPGPGAWAGT